MLDRAGQILDIFRRCNDFPSDALGDHFSRTVKPRSDRRHSAKHGFKDHAAARIVVRWVYQDIRGMKKLTGSLRWADEHDQIRHAERMREPHIRSGPCLADDDGPEFVPMPAPKQPQGGQPLGDSLELEIVSDDQGQDLILRDAIQFADRRTIEPALLCAVDGDCPAGSYCEDYDPSPLCRRDTPVSCLTDGDCPGDLAPDTCATTLWTSDHVGLQTTISLEALTPRRKN